MTQANTLRDRRPTDILLNLLVTLLAPMFLAAADGDLVFARIAAIETITEYRAHSQLSLIRVANIIAFGIATLGSLSLSMQDDLPIPLVLRLRGNANALDRSAERNERSLRATRPAAAPEAAAAEPPPARTAPAQSALTQPAPAPSTLAQPGLAGHAPARQASVQQATASPGAARLPVQPVPAGHGSDQAHRRMWAAAMAEVAAEETAALDTSPPAQRKDMTMRIAALTTAATELISGGETPRPKPGELAWMTQPVRR